jgi:Acetyltransferase (GNAT) domain
LTTGSGIHMRVVVVRGGEELQQHLAALEELVTAAMEPNVFYEPWVLFPAIDAFGPGRDLWFVLVYGIRESDKQPMLCGFFPFERGRRYGGMPITVFRMWKYGTAYCGLCTPLLRQGTGDDVLTALHAWAQESPDGPALLEWHRFSGDGPVYKLLIDFLTRSGRASLHVESRTRPLLCRRADADEFMRLGYSARHLSTNRRKERRLAEQGRMEFYELTMGDDVDAWAQEFIELESAGWKAGQAGAVAASDASRRFFTAVIKRGWERGSLMILGLRLDGVSIGSMCNLLAAPGSFLYKVTFDERFSRYSPGELLQQENIRRMHARPAIQWMDSLAEPSFEHVYRWLDRRTVQSVVVSTGRGGGDLALSLSPAVQWLKGMLGGRTDESAKRPDGRAVQSGEVADGR